MNAGKRCLILKFLMIIIILFSASGNTCLYLFYYKMDHYKIIYKLCTGFVRLNRPIIYPSHFAILSDHSLVGYTTNTSTVGPSWPFLPHLLFLRFLRYFLLGVSASKGNPCYFLRFLRHLRTFRYSSLPFLFLFKS